MIKWKNKRRIWRLEPSISRGGGCGLWEEYFNIVTVEVRFATVCNPNNRPGNV